MDIIVWLSWKNCVQILSFGGEKKSIIIIKKSFNIRYPKLGRPALCMSIMHTAGRQAEEWEGRRRDNSQMVPAIFLWLT